MTSPKKSGIPYKVVPYKVVGSRYLLRIMQPFRPLRLNSNMTVQLELEIII